MEKYELLKDLGARYFGVARLMRNRETKELVAKKYIPRGQKGDEGAGLNSLACAELSIYLVLGLLRKQKEMDIAAKQRELGVPTGDTLFGKTVFIFGFGAIGVDLAIGVKILATKRGWPSDESSSEFDEISGLVDKKDTMENMYEFAGESDIVVTCLSLNKNTAGIVDTKFISSMKKGSLLVNIARRGILDYDAVYQHLKTGHLGGLGIDVAWFEPFNSDDPILKLPNVLITPTCWWCHRVLLQNYGKGNIVRFDNWSVLANSNSYNFDSQN